MIHQPLPVRRALTPPTKARPYGELELYARCACGWVSPPLPKIATVHQAVRDHVEGRRPPK